jgi:hypothetical protein
MTSLIDLWLPILVSSVVVFFASFLAWMVLPHHKPDIQFLDDEDAFAGALKNQAIKPGCYMFPGCDPASMKTDEGKARFKAGPWGTLSLQASPPNFGRNLGLVFAFYVVVSVFVAYIAHFSLHPGDGFMSVFRVAGVAGIACYCLGFIPGGIFFGRSVRSMAMDLIDGVVYGLLTGAVFGMLWPAAQALELPGL